MKENKIFYSFFLIIFLLHNTQGRIFRKIRDSVGCYWQSSLIDSFVSWLEENKISDKDFEAKNSVGAIFSNDDYLYAERVYIPV